MASTERLLRLGYVVNTDLQLRHVKTGSPFKFINQDHYERLAEAVAEYIQDLMVEKYGMERLELPFEEHLQGRKVQAVSEATCPVFLSSNAYTAKTLLILLCGTGRVMAGQWARKLCINDSFPTGSVLPFLEWAQENDMAVLVLNPNENVVETEQGMMRIPFNHSSAAHVMYAWDNICTHLPADHIAMVAHSYGGVNTCELLEYRGSEVLQRLRCVAFTDSVHSSSCIKALPVRQQHFLIHSCINWASSCQPLDTVLVEASPPESVFLKELKVATEKKIHHSQEVVPETENSQKETCGEEAAAGEFSPAAGTSVQGISSYDLKHDQDSTGAEADEQDENAKKACRLSSGGSLEAHSKEEGAPAKEDQESTVGEIRMRQQVDWGSQEQDDWENDVAKNLDKNDEEVVPTLKHLLDLDSDSSSGFGSVEGKCQRGRKKKKYDYHCKQVSAGIDVHELTTMKAFNSVCQFILEKIKSAEQQC